MPRGKTKITRKNQVTIPVSEMRKAGLEPNDPVLVIADGAGRVVIERFESVVEEHAGMLRGTWPGGVEEFLEWRRREWSGHE
jgi:AbrB family looped-hinge helix DNA binding protein